MKLHLRIILIVLCILFGAHIIRAQEQDKGSVYRVDQPGTITFTVGVTIKGKIDKPQVMIFLPKQKTIYKPITFTHSFKEDLMDPLPFTPITK